MNKLPSERNTTFQLKRALKAEDECCELRAKIIKMEASIAAARVQALEEAVKVCEGASSYLEHQQHLLASRDCANAIRALS